VSTKPGAGQMAPFSTRKQFRRYWQFSALPIAVFGV